jgi:hypothetical protein
MFLGATITVFLLVVWLLGGDLGALTKLRLRGASLVFAALVLQLLLFTRLGAGLSEGVVSVAHDATYVALLAFAAANVRRYPVLIVASLGLASNALAILSNGGRMPVTLSAWTAPGRSASAIERNGDANNNVLVGAHTHLRWLGDILGLPRFIPFANAVSVGDVLILVGVALLIQRLAFPRSDTIGTSATGDRSSPSDSGAATIPS